MSSDNHEGARALLEAHLADAHRIADKSAGPNDDRAIVLALSVIGNALLMIDETLREQL